MRTVKLLEEEKNSKNDLGLKNMEGETIKGHVHQVTWPSQDAHKKQIISDSD